jgi:hypothetical protein
LAGSCLKFKCHPFNNFVSKKFVSSSTAILKERRRPSEHREGHRELTNTPLTPATRITFWGEIITGSYRHTQSHQPAMSIVVILFSYHGIAIILFTPSSYFVEVKVKRIVFIYFAFLESLFYFTRCLSLFKSLGADSSKRPRTPLGAHQWRFRSNKG